MYLIIYQYRDKAFDLRPMIDFCKLNWIWRYDILFKNIIFIAIRKQTKSKIALFSSKCLNDKPNRFFSSIVLIQRHGN